MDFDSVQDALLKLGTNADASEAHGTLCGLFMGNETMAMWLWLAHMVDQLPEQGDVLA
ncbi:MAG: UPF0149 family protein, partial [Gammaproteobacteria bacterium]